MGKLVSIVGNSGVGKTTLTRKLCELFPFPAGFEQHVERPFYESFSQDLRRYALPNQIDYLLFRAEQEQAIRSGDRTGLLDGGLDEDFYVFTRLFFERGYLKDNEYRLCERLHTFLRGHIPPPDLLIRLEAPLSVIRERYRRRGRELEIAELEDLTRIERLLDDWFSALGPAAIITVDASKDDFCSNERLQDLLRKMEVMLQA